MSVDRLPDFPLSPDSALARGFLMRGLTTFRAAARHVWHLPYGRNSSRAYSRVLDEARGTCSTKHALLAALAREHTQPVALMLGIYEMHEANTPGVGAALARFGLPRVPEAHCYLHAGGQRVDLTCVAHAPEPITHFLVEEEIAPEDIQALKVERHRAFLRDWAKERGLDPDHVWAAREACIATLAGATPPP